jgi:hypothetical protein
MAEKMSGIRSLRPNMRKGLESVPKIISDFMEEEVAAMQDIVGIAGEKAMSGIKNLLQWPWWRRTWIYREVLLADNLVFVCGSQTYEGTQIISGISLSLLDGAIDVHVGFLANRRVRRRL